MESFITEQLFFLFALHDDIHHSGLLPTILSEPLQFGLAGCLSFLPDRRVLPDVEHLHLHCTNKKK